LGVRGRCGRGRQGESLVEEDKGRGREIGKDAAPLAAGSAASRDVTVGLLQRRGSEARKRKGGVEATLLPRGCV